ncbi:MAG TPA: glycoside hydrolase domain-containing protein [Stellaceae bacterium]|nr:glycoside hydrolase domain-containing protein [Stellaceae bacterium]
MLKKIAPLAAALLLAACAGHPPPAPTSLGQRSFGPAYGIDLATDASDNLNELKDSRLGFVARYYRNPQSRWPTLSAREAQRLSSLGMAMVAIWESHSHDPAYFSYASGYGDAIAAHNQANALGQPAGSAIYFAVDFDAGPAALPAVDQYFRGVAAGLAAAGGGRPKYQAGVYGSGAVCRAIKGVRLAHYAWLSNSTAWSGYAGYDDWNIKQGGRVARLSFSHDYDEARQDYGGFRLTHSAALAPYASLAP